MKLRNNLRNELKARNMTQIELANRAGIRPATINTIVNDISSSISYDYLARMAEVFGVHNLNDLFYLEDDELLDFESNNKLKKFTHKNETINLIDSFNIEIKYIEIYTNLVELFTIKWKQSGTISAKKQLKEDKEDIQEKLKLSNQNIKRIKLDIIDNFKYEPNINKLYEYYNKVNHSAFKLDLSILLKEHAKNNNNKNNNN